MPTYNYTHFSPLSAIYGVVSSKAELLCTMYSSVNPSPFISVFSSQNILFQLFFENLGNESWRLKRSELKLKDTKSVLQVKINFTLKFFDLDSFSVFYASQPLFIY